MLLSLLNLPFRLGCQHGANPVGELYRLRVDTMNILLVMCAWHLEKGAMTIESTGKPDSPLATFLSPVAWGFSLECS